MLSSCQRGPPLGNLNDQEPRKQRRSPSLMTKKKLPLTEVGVAFMLLRVLLVPLCALGFFVGMGLLCWAVTNQGHWMGLFFLLISLLLLLLAFRVWARFWGPSVLGLLTLVIVGLGWYVTGKAPSGHYHGPQVPVVAHRSSNPQWRFRKYALANLVPEIDQFLLGFKVLPFLDPLFTRQQARNLSDYTQRIYQEMARNEQFHALGSVMPDAYLDMMMLGKKGHYYHYQPAKGRPPGERWPVLVFLHGSGGNFKAYTYLLRSIAEQHGMVLIAPSYGFGNWREPQTSKLVWAALEDLNQWTPIDRERLHLIGLSNGGLGVTQLAASSGSRFRSLTWLSPVFDDGLLSEQGLTDQCRNTRLLVYSGEEDNRVPWDYVMRSAKVLRARGLSVELEGVAEADHFMLFSDRERVISRLSAWVVK